MDRLNFIPEEAISLLAKKLNLSSAEVSGVISFYHDFRKERVGSHKVQICRSEACQAMGSRDLEKHVKTSLGIDYGESTKDQLIYLESVYCLGNCACSPSVRIDDDIHARVTPDSFDNLISDIKRSKTRDEGLVR
jgi:formate dehydrogenase subunit gamma